MFTDLNLVKSNKSLELQEQVDPQSYSFDE